MEDLEGKELTSDCWGGDYHNLRKVWKKKGKRARRGDRA